MDASDENSTMMRELFGVQLTIDLGMKSLVIPFEEMILVRMFEMLYS